MLKRLYVNNFLTLQNFEFNSDFSSVLLIGKNGTGKSSIGSTLRILNNIGSGMTSIDDLLIKEDFSFFHTELPMRFEISVNLENIFYKYDIVFEIPDNFKIPRIKSENLYINDQPCFKREQGDITFWYDKNKDPNKFHLDWHHIGLPQIGDSERDKNLEVFRSWLSRMIIISPIPQVIKSTSEKESDHLSKSCRNFPNYLRWLLGEYPSSYSMIIDFLKKFMPDLESFQNSKYSRDIKELKVVFNNNNKKIDFYYDQLSDGEKCLFLIATVLTAAKQQSNTLIFWDEPDSFISLWDMNKMISIMRQESEPTRQLILTSHNSAAIRIFSPENTYILSRAGHFEPTRIQLINDLIDSTDDVVDVIEANLLG